MSENKIYYLSKTANDDSALKFTQKIPDCPVETYMEINEDGVISVSSPEFASSPLAQTICAYQATLCTAYSRVKRALIKQLQKAYDDMDDSLSFYHSLSVLEMPNTAEIKDLFNKALQAHQKEMALLQERINSLYPERYERKQMNVALTQLSRLENILREEATAKFTQWGVFKPSKAKVEQYVRDNIASLVRKVNLEAAEISVLNDVLERQREAQMNLLYQQEYEHQMAALRNQREALEHSPITMDFFLAEDRKICSAAIEEKILNNDGINWPMSYSLEYNYDQERKGVIFKFALPSKSKVSLMKKFYKMKFKEIEVYRKQEETLEANYTSSIIELAIAVAKLTFNAHPYVENVIVCAYNDTKTKGWYKCIIHREAIADNATVMSLADIVNSKIQVVGFMENGHLLPIPTSAFEKLSIFDREQRVFFSDNIPLESEQMLGTSVTDLARTSIPALDKYIEWQMKQSDVMTMRGVKSVSDDSVQITAALMTRRYSDVMGYVHRRAADAGMPQTIKKSELVALEFKRNVNVYLSKVRETCAKHIEKALAYENDEKWKMAIKYYERCMECGCEDTLPYERLLELYVRIGDTERVNRMENLKMRLFQ